MPESQDILSAEWRHVKPAWGGTCDFVGSSFYSFTILDELTTENFQTSSLALYVWTWINFRNDTYEKGLVFGNMVLSEGREVLRRIQLWHLLNLGDGYTGVIRLCAFLYVWHILQINKILVSHLTSLRKHHRVHSMEFKILQLLTPTAFPAPLFMTSFHTSYSSDTELLSIPQRCFRPQVFAQAVTMSRRLVLCPLLPSD